jgi:hypothetical protein
MLLFALRASADGWVCRSNTETGPTSTSTSTSYGETATWTYVFVWQTSTGAPAPQTAYFKVNSGAGWTGGWEGQEPSWSADDGFEDQRVPLCYTNGGDFYSGGGYSSTTPGLLIQESGASGTVTITKTLSVSVSTAGLARLTQMSVGCTITPDTRGISITSSADPTYFKGSFGATDSDGDPVVVPVQNPAGYGDIGLTPDIPYDEPTTDITYTAHPVGNWAVIGSSDTWTSSLKKDSASETLGWITDTIQTYTNVYIDPWIMDNGSIQGNDASGQPGMDEISISYTNGNNSGTPYTTGNDGDGATAKANYIMALYYADEVSKSAKANTPSYVPQTVTPASPGYAAEGGGISVTWNAPPVGWGIAAGSFAALATLPMPTPWLNAAFAVAGVSVTDLTPTPYSGVDNFDTAWGGSHATYLDYDGNPISQPPDSEKSEYHMVPTATEGYSQHWVLHDAYNSSGFAGETKAHVDSDGGLAYWGGVFRNWVGENTTD